MFEKRNRKKKQISGMVPKKGTWVFICNFVEGNSHNYIKNHPIFENKSLFYAKFCGALN